MSVEDEGRTESSYPLQDVSWMGTENVGFVTLLLSHSDFYRRRLPSVPVGYYADHRRVAQLPERASPTVPG